MARSFGNGFETFARKVAPEYILSMMCEAHRPSVRGDELNDEQVNIGPTGKHDVGYKEIWGVLLWRKFKGQ